MADQPDTAAIAEILDGLDELRRLLAATINHVGGRLDADARTELRRVDRRIELSEHYFEEERTATRHLHPVKPWLDRPA